MEKKSVRIVYYGKNKIEYILTRKSVKNINLRVKSDGTVNVSANTRHSVATIDSFVASNGQMILKALEKYRTRKTEKLSYVDGECCKIFGDTYTLKIVESKKEYVDFKDNTVCIYVKDKENFAKKERLYEKWAGEVLLKLVTKYSDELYPMYKAFTTKPNLKIRKVKSIWGSCNIRTNTITVNLRLIEFIPQCALFIMVHEYTHFIHHNHSKAFHEAVARVMPDWKIYDSILKK